jgi:hypothetical protein
MKTWVSANTQGVGLRKKSRAGKEVLPLARVRHPLLCNSSYIDACTIYDNPIKLPFQSGERFAVYVLGPLNVFAVQQIWNR